LDLITYNLIKNERIIDFVIIDMQVDPQPSIAPFPFGLPPGKYYYKLKMKLLTKFWKKSRRLVFKNL
jgi:hypothetical protein